MSAETTDHEPDSDSSPLLSADQVGEKLNISGRCVLNWYYGKIIPAAIHQGKVIRFREADVMAALEEARKDSGTTGGQAIPEDVLRLAMWLMFVRLLPARPMPTSQGRFLFLHRLKPRFSRFPVLRKGCSACSE